MSAERGLGIGRADPADRGPAVRRESYPAGGTASIGDAVGILLAGLPPAWRPHAPSSRPCAATGAFDYLCV